MADPIDRYQTLKLKESLSDPSLYALACNELSFILKNAYAKSPKNLQLLVFQETLYAFSCLPEVHTESAISAANSLVQSAESSLPKQKRALAVAEHKHAVVATKRKCKTVNEEKGLDLISEDVLLHIFSFLDLHSLVNASAVCRSWNAVASDNSLWKMLFAVLVSSLDNVRKDYSCLYGVTRNEDKFSVLDEVCAGVRTDWRRTLKRAFKETSFSKYKSYRGYCRVCCSIVWLNSTKCPDKTDPKDGWNHQISPISRQHIVDYILESSILDSSSSDSDDDCEKTSIFSNRLWAYRRRTVR
ncbi:F-box protein [Striga hermonthica]|uniref:F-box protein n=1 Tax=Striga hermonthica TaxID=68872 RepID=A0A9N7MS04_STRHE|nr:F-box protein [Striga hermonthica]